MLKHMTLHKAWEILHKTLSDEKVDIAIRREIAKSLAMKNVPQQIDVHAEVNQMPAIQLKADEATDNRISEFLIGSPHSPENT